MDKEGCSKEAKMDPGQYKIFDAKWIFDWIYEDSTETLVVYDWNVVLTYVVDLVEERAMELGKTELWQNDAWGRQPKGRLG